MSDNPPEADGQLIRLLAVYCLSLAGSDSAGPSLWLWLWLGRSLQKASKQLPGVLGVQRIGWSQDLHLVYLAKQIS